MQHLTRHIGIIMSDDLARSAKEEIEAVRQDRDRLPRQMRKSPETIARPQELLRRIDDMLAKAGRNLNCSARLRYLPLSSERHNNCSGGWVLEVSSG
jgi:hypothetical protein